MQQQKFIYLKDHVSGYKKLLTRQFFGERLSIKTESGMEKLNLKLNPSRLIHCEDCKK